MKPTAPGSLSHIFAFAIYFFLAFIFRYIKLKIQKYLAAIFPYLFYLVFDLSIYYKFISRLFAYLCAGAVYVVLLGSPTVSITLVSYLRKIPTAAVLHHPFLFGEIPT